MIQALRLVLSFGRQAKVDKPWFVGLSVQKVARCALVTNAWLERLVLVRVLSFVLRLLLASFAWCVVSFQLFAWLEVELATTPGFILWERGDSGTSAPRGGYAEVFWAASGDLSVLRLPFGSFETCYLK